MPIKTLGILNRPDSLRIFDNFEVDRKLPKYTKKVKAQEGRVGYSKKQSWSSVEVEDDEEEVGNQSSRMAFSSGSSGINPSITVLGVTAEPAPSFWQRLFPKKAPPPPPPAPEPDTPVDDVFEAVLSNAQELKVYEDRNVAYDKLIANAVKGGQTSLVEMLEKEKGIRTYENALFAKGITKLLDEKQLLKFTEKAPKGLCLDWVKHFTRPIPEAVINRKVECDEAELFDNYVVLHYDPESKATSGKDRADAERKARDPILFGVLKGSRRLYFVGDWVDELCDLTLQQIAESLGTNLEMKA